MKKIVTTIKDYFLQEYISSTENTLEKAKIQSVFWSSLFIAVFLILYLPALNGLGSAVVYLGLFCSAACIYNLFLLKKYHNFKLPAKILFSIFLSFILMIEFVTVPENVATYVVWAIVLLIQVTLILGKKWSFGFLIAFTAGMAFTAFLKENQIDFAGLIGLPALADTSQLNYTTPFKVGIPLTLILIILHQFIDNHREINTNLIGVIDQKDFLFNKLEISESKYRHLIDGADDFVYEVDNQGYLTFTNLACTKNWSLINTKEGKIRISELVPEKYQKEFWKNSLEQIAEKKKFTYFEYPILNKEGGTIWIGQKARINYDKDGNLVNIFCIARDITKKLKTEEILTQAKDSAEKAALAKANFLSSMSHEIRTPMNAIVGVINLMKEEKLSPQQTDFMNTLRFSADNLLSLIQNILDFNKIDQGKMVLDKKDFNIQELMNSLAMGLRNLANEKSLDLKFNVEPMIPKSIIGDPLRISQILSNLVSNSIKFTDEGEINVDLILDKETDDFVDIYFSVTDTGIGIPKDKLKLIFEDFKQVNDNTIREGAGLGLSITKNLIDLHNSKIYAESELGEGSKFSFIISFAKSQITAPGSLKGTPSKESQTIQTKEVLTNKLILLVEDNLINQKITTKILQKWGLQVDIAENGKIATEMVIKKEYDLVLMDLQMPIMNGIEATEAIRKMGGSYLDLPIIALTASAVLEIKTNALKAGLDDFITKPFKPDALYDALVLFSKKGKQGLKK